MAVTSRIPKIEEEEVVNKPLPQEVLRLQQLLLDNGWKMLMERIDKTIDESIDTLSKPIPLGMTLEQKQVYYDDLEKIKMKIDSYRELKKLPETMMLEYGEYEFSLDNSKQV